MLCLNRVKKLFELKKDTPRKIIARSNIVQYDVMGYPLRLCVMSDGEQIWLDSYHEDTDIELKWEIVGDK